MKILKYIKNLVKLINTWSILLAGRPDLNELPLILTNSRAAKSLLDGQDVDLCIAFYFYLLFSTIRTKKHYVISIRIYTF